MKPEPLVSIGYVAKRTGNTVSLIRYYANEGLIPSVRTEGGIVCFLVQLFGVCRSSSLRKTWDTH